MEGKNRAGWTAAVLSAALLCGCGGGYNVVNYGQNPEEVTTITFFGNKYEAANVTVIEEIISDFMEENPDIRVSYESLKGTEYYEALEKRMAADKGDDVFMVNHDTVLLLGGKGQLAELSDLSCLENFTDRMLEQMQGEEGIYWVPTTVSAFGLYCNLELLKEHNQSVPDTLPEWKAVCGYFAEKNITPVIANNDISLKTAAIGEGFYEVYQEGRQGQVLESLNRGEEKLSDYLTPGFALMEEFIQKGYIDAQTALETQKTSDDLEAFARGENPFMLTGAWAAGRVADMKPGFSFEVVPLPLLEDGALLVINPDTRLSVNAKSEHLEEAKRFVEFFTREENIQRFADQQSSFSPLKGGSPSSVKEIQPLTGAYESGRTVIGTDGQLELPIWELTAKASEKLLSGESLEDVMEWMDRQTQNFSVTDRE